MNQGGKDANMAISVMVALVVLAFILMLVS
jgi:hypothetical protein